MIEVRVENEIVKLRKSAKNLEKSKDNGVMKKIQQQLKELEKKLEKP